MRYGKEIIKKLEKTSATIVTLPSGSSITIGGQKYFLNANLTIDTSIIGAGGLESAVAVDTEYTAYAVVTGGGSVQLIGSTVSPAGFDAQEIVGQFFTDNASDVSHIVDNNHFPPEEYRAVGNLALAAVATKCTYFTSYDWEYSTVLNFGVIDNDSNNGLTFTATKRCSVVASFDQYDPATSYRWALGKNLTGGALTSTTGANVNTLGVEHMFAWRVDASGANGSGTLTATGSTVLEVGDTIHMNQDGNISNGISISFKPRLQLLISDVK
jgi:hypothetical protein